MTLQTPDVLNVNALRLRILRLLGRAGIALVGQICLGRNDRWLTIRFGGHANWANTNPAGFNKHILDAKSRLASDGKFGLAWDSRAELVYKIPLADVKVDIRLGATQPVPKDVHAGLV